MAPAEVTDECRSSLTFYTVFTLKHRSAISENGSKAKPKNNLKGSDDLTTSLEFRADDRVKLTTEVSSTANGKTCFPFQVLTSYWPFQTTS